MFRINETQFLRLVIDFATKHGWLVYHVAKTRFRKRGFPDLLMLRHGRLVVVEIKSTEGKLHPEQEVWLREFGKCKAVEVYLWRPSDWGSIQELLQ